MISYSWINKGGNSGPVVRINSGADSGEISSQVDISLLVWGNRSEYYTVVNGVFTAMSAQQKQSYDNWVAQNITDIQSANSTFLNTVSTYQTITVSEGTFTHAGGLDTANRLNADVILAQHLGENTITILDVNLTPISLSLASALATAAALGVIYRQAFLLQQSTLRSIGLRTFSG